MALNPGDCVGSFELVRLLGAGGMGQVWLASEPRLGRRVALKFLPDELARDLARMARFDQEARAASGLNHPNVCHIYSVGETEGGQQFIAMEWVEGTTLRELLRRSALPSRDALRVGIQIGGALAAAHHAGIVHRDLKPENVMLRPDGLVKVLDFGLAKPFAARQDGAAAETTHTVRTMPGTMVGTLAYMSPEQARGQPVDARTDIWSLGAMLYEMVTGRNPFLGPSDSDILAAILDREPAPLARFEPNVSHELQRIVTKTLRKDRSQRYQVVQDVLLDLEAHSDDLAFNAHRNVDEHRALAPIAAAGPQPRSSRRWLWVGVGGIVAALVAMLVFKTQWPTRLGNAGGSPPMRVVPLTAMNGFEQMPTFSPDGHAVAFAHGKFGANGTSFFDGNWGVYATTVGSADVRRLSPDHRSDRVADGWPSWSPDGKHIAFVRALPPGQNGEMARPLIYVMSPFGADIRKVSDFPVSDTFFPHSLAISWSPDSKFIVAGRYPTPPNRSDAGVYFIPLHGGSPRRIVAAKSHATNFSPIFSPDGDRLTYLSCISFEDCEIEAVAVNSALEASGPSRRVVALHTGATFVSWSPDGRWLIYDSFLADTSYLWRVDAEGQRPPERIEVAGNRAKCPVVSRAGNRLAFVRSERANTEIYRLGPGNQSTPVVTSSSHDANPDISPDGTRIAFSSARSGERGEIWLANIDGSGAQQLTHGPGRWQSSPSWSPDGRRLVFDSQGDDGYWHIWMIDAAGGTPQQLTRGVGDQNGPSWSSAGEHVYYSATVDRRHREIWRVKTDGTAEEQITRVNSASYVGREALGGTHVVYKSTDERTLLLVPLAGGSPRRLASCAGDVGFRPGTEDVYYAGCEDDVNPPLHVVDPATGRDRILGRMTDFGGSISVSRDGRVILFTRLIWQRESDLMIVENFR